MAARVIWEKLLSLLSLLFSQREQPAPPPPDPEPVPEPTPEPTPEPVKEPEAPKGPPELTLCYESKPFKLTQKWGVYDPKTYSKFGYTRHSGIDIAHGANGRVRAPFDYSIIGTKSQPTGGGNVLSIVSRNEYLGPDGKPALVRVDYLHLAKYIRTEGSGRLGDLLCIAGNTGAATTGPHVHIKYSWVRRIKGKLVEIEKNEADNSFDPIPYYTGEYAVDKVA